MALLVLYRDVEVLAGPEVERKRLRAIRDEP
jgi:hypothetical protein